MSCGGHQICVLSYAHVVKSQNKPNKIERSKSMPSLTRRKRERISTTYSWPVPNHITFGLHTARSGRRAKMYPHTTTTIATKRRRTSAPDACLRAAPVSRRALPTTAFVLMAEIRCCGKWKQPTFRSVRQQPQLRKDPLLHHLHSSVTPACMIWLPLE